MIPKILCSYGFDWEILQNFLSQEPEGKLVFVEDRESVSCEHPLLQDERIWVFRILSPLHLHSVAYEVASLAALWKLEVLNRSGSSYFEMFEGLLLQAHKEVSCQLSDVSDYGCRVLRHAQKNMAHKTKSLLSLKNAFANLPAVLVGAGPSLEKQVDRLPVLQDKALIFAAGSSVEHIPCTPHFVAAIDPHTPMQNQLDPETVLCVQARAHPQNGSAFQGTTLMAPDGHLQWINALMGFDSYFDSGWTVGNFMVALALHFGCDPIFCVGMDYCYEGKRKHAFSEKGGERELVAAIDAKGQTVWTQTDWLMAVEWMKHLPMRYPERTFYTIESRMSYFSDIRHEELSLKEMGNLRHRVQQSVNEAPYLDSLPLHQWESALLEARQHLEEGTEIQETFVFDVLLKPLWEKWRGVFARETRQGLPIHQAIFFKNVIQEHLDALKG